ncbi:MAG: hypothetical protein ACFFAY_07750 [Promethearchaeota archaeon]
MGESERTPCEDILLDENRGRLVFNRGLILRQPLRFVKALGPLLRAHHPFCSHYESHLFSLGGRKWCIGCFFNSLSFFLALGFLVIGWFAIPLSFDRSYLFWGGAAFVLISFFISALNRSENRHVKVLSKLMLGSSFACISWSIMLADGLETNLEVKMGFIFFLYLVVVTILGIKRIAEVERECAECEYEMRWSKCPGFRDILCPLIDASYLRPLKSEKPEEEA